MLIIKNFYTNIVCLVEMSLNLYTKVKKESSLNGTHKLVLYLELSRNFVYDSGKHPTLVRCRAHYDERLAKCFFEARFLLHLHLLAIFRRHGAKCALII